MSNRLKEICKIVTGKDIVAYIDNGFYAITAEQAKKLCGGNLPRSGYEKTMNLVDDIPAPCFNSSWDYVIAQTRVLCRTDLKDGNHWSIREK